MQSFLIKEYYKVDKLDWTETREALNNKNKTVGIGYFITAGGFLYNKKINMIFFVFVN